MFQEFKTTIDADTEKFQNEKFDILVEPLEKNTYFFEGTNLTQSLSGFTLILKRSSTPFFMNTYLPTGLLTIASFIGFVIPVEMVPGRMALLVTTFLMLVNIRSTERRMGPIVSEKDVSLHTFIKM